jgi:hypothetical protein
MTEEKIGNYHILYGSWDDVSNNQFLVYYHCNGVDCTVFIMHGADYGGGVSFYFDVNANVLESIIRASLNDYDIKQAVIKLGESIKQVNK